MALAARRAARGPRARARRLLRRALDALPAPPDVVLVIATAEWKAATHWLVKAVRDAVPSVVAVLPATAPALRERPGAGGVVARGIAIAALRLGRPLELKGPAAVAAASAAAAALCVHDSAPAPTPTELDLVRLLELDADVLRWKAGLLGPPGLSQTFGTRSPTHRRRHRPRPHFCLSASCSPDTLAITSLHFASGSASEARAPDGPQAQTALAESPSLLQEVIIEFAHDLPPVALPFRRHLVLARLALADERAQKRLELVARGRGAEQFP